MKPLLWIVTLGASLLVLAGCGGESGGKSAELDRLPAVLNGSTVDATHGDDDPDCGESGPTVWYRLERAQKGRIGIAFHAGGDLEATVCAMEKSVAGLASVKQDSTDERGNAGFDFDGNAGATYYFVVSQKPDSRAGTFRLNVTPIPRPGNDERASASAPMSLPSTMRATTAGATSDTLDPPCTEGAPSVWYRVSRAPSGQVVVHLQSEPNTETAICALKKVRSHLDTVGTGRTDDRGNASLAFRSKAGSTYYVVVSRPTAKSGPFSLTVQQPDKPHRPPGTVLRQDSGTGQLDPLINPQDAWAVPMEKGRTYRLTLVTRPKQCVSMAVYSIRARRFSTGVVAAKFDCAGTEFFAPGPDGGGTYPVLLSAGGEATSYQLFVNPVEPDDSGPGVAIESGTSVKGRVTPADPLDLYRFDVPGTSNVEIGVASKRYVDVELKDGDGDTIASPETNSIVERRLDTGTYYLAVERGAFASGYTLRVFVRYVTTTSLTVSGTSSVTIGPEDSVSINTATSPDPGLGVTEVQADFFDVATEKWVFRQLWEVDPGSSISFTPGAVGKWRVRATFQANDVASTSRTGYATIIVSTV